MTIKKVNCDNQIYVVGVDMDNRSPEEIAKDAALQIVELFDRIAEERSKKDERNNKYHEKTCKHSANLED